MIFAERNYMDEPIEKIAARNMFYNEKGNHVRTKKEILDENGNIRKRCKIIKKGEVYERQIFTVKDIRFKQGNFLDEVKAYYTDLINQLIKNDKEKLAVFKRGDVCLATKKIGKNNPREHAILNSNSMVKDWNKTVDEFYRLFNNASSDYRSYKEEVKNWEAKYGENSLQRKLAEKQAEIKKRQEEREYIYRPPTNRGKDKEVIATSFILCIYSFAILYNKINDCKY